MAKFSSFLTPEKMLDIFWVQDWEKEKFCDEEETLHAAGLCHSEADEDSSSLRNYPLCTGT
jgi:hypothetical protein